MDVGVGVGGAVSVGSCVDVQAVAPKAMALHSNVVRYVWIKRFIDNPAADVEGSVGLRTSDSLPGACSVRT